MRVIVLSTEEPYSRPNLHLTESSVVVIRCKLLQSHVIKARIFGMEHCLGVQFIIHSSTGVADSLDSETSPLPNCKSDYGSCGHELDRLLRLQFYSAVCM